MQMAQYCTGSALSYVHSLFEYMSFPRVQCVQAVLQAAMIHGAVPAGPVMKLWYAVSGLAQRHKVFSWLMQLLGTHHVVH